MNSSIRLIFIALIFFSANSYANDEPVVFKNKQLEKRYEHLIKEIRCLVCQNQSLADSHADLAQDLRNEIYNMIVSGKTNDDIKQFLVERYGDFVLYKPPLKKNTWLLWFGPFVFLPIALFIAIIIIKKQSNSDNINVKVNEQQKRRLAKLLNEQVDGTKE